MGSLSKDRRKVIILIVLLASCAMLLRVGWVLGGPQIEPAASAQTTGQQQYIPPDEQGNGRYVFRGSGADSVTTDLFDISTNQWSILSESDPPNNQPVVTVMNENGDLIDAQLASDAQYNSDTYNVTADPGRYRLDITPAVANATWTVTVTSGGATGGDGSTAPTQQGNGNLPLMQSGGPKDGPVPHLPSGGCPDEFPVDKGDACFGTGAH